MNHGIILATLLTLTSTIASADPVADYLNDMYAGTWMANQEVVDTRCTPEQRAELEDEIASYKESNGYWGQ